jgi:hypothetical protein
MRKTAIEIIDETVAFYSEDVKRRAVLYGADAAKVRGYINPDGPEYINSSVCMYITDDGRSCAFGRCMTSPDKTIAGIDTLIYNKKKSDGISGVDDLLKEEYSGHSVNFWCALQDLHDEKIYWDDDGLSQTGMERVEKLKEKWG